MQLVTRSSVRVLDFDIECRPLSWYAGDFTSREITAIACQFTDQKRMHCWALGEVKLPDILENFIAKYNEADIVTGHYIRGFDLPNINMQLAELGMKPLAPKLTQDTKTDLIKLQGGSKSQENLGGLLALEHPKVTMTQADWREANRLTKKGIRQTKERVTGDVRQHIEMREKLLQRGLLRPPKVWRSDGGKD